ncbi:hypothetical protein F4Z99_17445 [Candidatus Poribacteria bacterium]|nr:hypothetical protein [Candidatus Poribacteria bacterium]
MNSNKIPQRAAEAFSKRLLYSSHPLTPPETPKTEVKELNGDQVMLFNQNIIALRKHSLGFDDKFWFDVYITHAGVPTHDTMTRLSALLSESPLNFAVTRKRKHIYVIDAPSGKEYQLTEKLTSLRTIYDYFKEQDKN